MRVVMPRHSQSKLNIIDIFVIAFFVWGYGRITTEIYRPVLMLIGIVPVVWILVLKRNIHKPDISTLLYTLFLLLFLEKYYFLLENFLIIVSMRLGK